MTASPRSSSPAASSKIAIGRYLSAPSATGAIDNATMDAIKLLKLAVAAGTYGQDALRPNEQRDGGDRYAGGTFDATGDTRTWTSPPPPPSRQRVSHTDDKRLAIYVPRTTPAGRNNVHVFFTPDTANPMAFLTTQGLRAEEESSGWILIGVPGLDEDAVPNWVTISTAEIETCLRAAGRSSLAIMRYASALTAEAPADSSTRSASGAPPRSIWPRWNV